MQHPKGGHLQVVILKRNDVHTLRTPAARLSNGNCCENPGRKVGH